MIPLLSTKDMREADARAVAKVGTDVLVERAGYAVGAEARRLLGSLYGKKIVVVAGPGLNGADGRRAAVWLRTRGAKVSVVEATSAPASLEGFDLVIDAAFGLGCSRPYHAPEVGSTPVLSVDIVSGVDADTGAVMGKPLHATSTAAVGALKPGHLFGEGAALAGELSFSSLGIATDARDGVLETSDLKDFVRMDANDNKWRHAVLVVGGSPTMLGAPELCSRGALATGASMVRVLVPSVDAHYLNNLPAETVRVAAYTKELVEVATHDASRLRVTVLGPGLGRDPETQQQVRAFVHAVTTPLVLDADGLNAVDIELLAGRPNAKDIILTPHDGEFERLTGHAPGENRLEDVRSLAKTTNCVVLLKGPTTIISTPDGAVRVVRSGTSALATAGTGDVLAGMIGGAISRGFSALDSAAFAAHLHGLAGQRLGIYAGASELPQAVGDVLEDLRHGGNNGG